MLGVYVFSKIVKYLILSPTGVPRGFDTNLSSGLLYDFKNIVQ